MKFINGLFNCSVLKKKEWFSRFSNVFGVYPTEHIICLLRQLSIAFFIYLPGCGRLQ